MKKISFLMIIVFATAALAQQNVEILDFDYSQPTITVNAGESIAWTNVGTAPHTVTSIDKTLDSGRIGPGESYSKTFTTPGEYEYACAFHPRMKAKVVVLAGAAPTIPMPESPLAPEATPIMPAVLPEEAAPAMPAAAPSEIETLQSSINERFAALERQLNEQKQTTSEEITRLRTAAASQTERVAEETRQTLEERLLIDMVLIASNIVLFILAIVALLLAISRKRTAAAIVEKKPASVSQQLQEYIKKAKSAGKDNVAIRSSLVASGWKAEDVDAALAGV